MIPRNRTNDRLVALFVAGLVLFMPPMLLVFNHSGRVAGIPVLYIYVFAAWATIILMAGLASRGMTGESPAAVRQPETPPATGPDA